MQQFWEQSFRLIIYNSSEMGTCGFLLGVLRRTYFSHISLYVEEDLIGQILLQELMVQPMQ